MTIHFYKLRHVIEPSTREDMIDYPDGEDEFRVMYTEKDGVRISTIFLSIDHAFMSGGPPILFETMVFGGPFDEEQERYATWKEAIAGHRFWEEKVFGWKPPKP